MLGRRVRRPGSCWHRRLFCSKRALFFNQLYRRGWDKSCPTLHFFKFSFVPGYRHLTSLDEIQCRHNQKQKGKLLRPNFAPFPDYLPVTNNCNTPAASQLMPAPSIPFPEVVARLHFCRNLRLSLFKLFFRLLFEEVSLRLVDDSLE